MNKSKSPGNNVQTDTLDIVLTGLSSAQPFPDFEKRLLETLEAHNLNAVPQHSRAPLPFVTSRAVTAFAAIAALLTLLIVTPTKYLHPLRRPTAAVSTPSLIPALALSTRPPARHRRTRVRFIRFRTLPLSTITNYPAPPMPLTTQEKLLLQLTRTLTPGQLASLSRTQQAQFTVEDEFHFDHSFPAPIPPPSWPALPPTLPPPPPTTPIL